MWEQPEPSSLGGDQGHAPVIGQMQGWKGRWDLGSELPAVRMTVSEALPPALLCQFYV